MTDDDRTLRIGDSTVDPDSLDWQDVTKRPVTVEAVHLNVPFTVETMEGTMEADAGHYLIRGVKGELYPCDPAIFAQTYQVDSSKAPKYSPEDVQNAMQQFRQNTLDHVGFNITDTDARAGARAFLSLLREEVSDG